MVIENDESHKCGNCKSGHPWCFDEGVPLFPPPNHLGLGCYSWRVGKGGREGGRESVDDVTHCFGKMARRPKPRHKQTGSPSCNRDKLAWRSKVPVLRLEHRGRRRVLSFPRYGFSCITYFFPHTVKTKHQDTRRNDRPNQMSIKAPS